MNVLSRKMRRGFAIMFVYLGLLLVPFLLAALIVPSLVTEVSKLADNAPQYATDVTNFVEDNKRLQKLNKDYDITGKLQEQAEKIPEKLGDAAGTVRDVGIGLVNSIFTVVDDPDPHRLHARQRAKMGRRGPAPVTRGPGGVQLRRRARPLEQGDLQLRGGGPVPGGDRRASSPSSC